MKRLAKEKATILAIVILLIPVAGIAGNDFRLKPGARGRICVDCHDELRETLNKPYVHTPLKKGDCTGCHSPHASNHQKLISDETQKICFKCHEDLIAKDALSTHEVAIEGQCARCHDAHASSQKALLLKPANQVCSGCHEDVVARASKAKIPHKPVQKGCVTCHDPHASREATHLLNKEVPGQCTTAKCHVTNNAKFMKAHAGYPVGDKRCTSCHDVHGSNQAGMLYDQVHEPVAKKKCEKCHVAANTRNPFKTKRSGQDLCKGCHVDQFKKIFGKTAVHSPVLSGDGCLNCHSPHASPAQGLLRASAIETCGRCHHDTISRQKRSATQHEPIAKGECGACHDPHGSDQPFYLTKGLGVELCQDCHDWQTHVTHPIGKDVVDPRDKNLTVTCLSCHRSHGTEFKYFTHYEPEKTLCLQCHKDFQ